MAWKFKKFRIKWDKGKKQFKKKKRDRATSYKAHLRWRKNRSKMKASLRKSKVKRKLSMRRNKAMGIFRKLKLARKRFASVLKNDVSLNQLVNNVFRLDESNDMILDMSHKDLDDLIDILKDLKSNIEIDDDKEHEEFMEFINDAIKSLHDYKDIEELEDTDKEFLEDIISFIEEYGEEIGALEQDD